MSWLLIRFSADVKSRHIIQQPVKILTPAADKTVIVKKGNKPNERDLWLY